MEDPKAILWLCMLVAAFLSGKMLGYASRKHDEQEEQEEQEEQKPKYLKELALCRDVFDTPSPDDKLETTWVSAMQSPESVPLYIEACRQDYIDQLDAKDEEIRVLSAKIVDQQKHIASLKEG